jgi:hypothetical protein
MKQIIHYFNIKTETNKSKARIVCDAFFKETPSMLIQNPFYKCIYGKEPAIELYGLDLPVT